MNLRNKVELAGAKRSIEESPKNSLAWYLACISWNRALSSIDGYMEVLDQVGRPSNVDLDEGFAVTPEFDLSQPLRKLN